jgi:hypothetical protein
MGTWAEGNFDNDEAGEYVDELIEHFSENIEEILDDAERGGLDETRLSIAFVSEGEGRLMPSVELIALLAERYNAAPPKEETVHKWRERYLKVYDKQIDGLDPKSGYKEARRKTIEKTFEWLESLSRTSWSEE